MFVSYPSFRYGQVEARGGIYMMLAISWVRSPPECRVILFLYSSSCFYLSYIEYFSNLPETKILLEKSSGCYRCSSSVTQVKQTQRRRTRQSYRSSTDFYMILHGDRKDCHIYLEAAALSLYSDIYRPRF